MNRGICSPRMGTVHVHNEIQLCCGRHRRAHTTHRNSTIGTFQWRNEIRIYKYFAYVNYDIVFSLGNRLPGRCRERSNYLLLCTASLLAAHILMPCLGMDVLVELVHSRCELKKLLNCSSSEEPQY